MILKPMYGMDGSGESVRFFKGPIHSQAKRNWDLSWVTRDGAKRRVRARAHCSSALSVSTNVTSHDTSTTAWVPTPSGVWRVECPLPTTVTKSREVQQPQQGLLPSQAQDEEAFWIGSLELRERRAGWFWLSCGAGISFTVRTRSTLRLKP